MNKKLKANASFVSTTLGGGMYGHLGLLISATQNATLLQILFTSPVNLGLFNPSAAGTGLQIKTAKEIWHEAKFTFKLRQTTAEALIAQAIDASDATYLAALQNANTSCYGNSIYTLVNHLFKTYGCFTPQQVKTRELE